MLILLSPFISAFGSNSAPCSPHCTCSNETTYLIKDIIWLKLHRNLCTVVLSLVMKPPCSPTWPTDSEIFVNLLPHHTIPPGSRHLSPLTELNEDKKHYWHLQITKMDENEHTKAHIVTPVTGCHSEQCSYIFRVISPWETNMKTNQKDQNQKDFFSCFDCL